MSKVCHGARARWKDGGKGSHEVWVCTSRCKERKKEANDKRRATKGKGRGRVLSANESGPTAAEGNPMMASNWQAAFCWKCDEGSQLAGSIP
jgi:hypothetical protein